MVINLGKGRPRKNDNEKRKIIAATVDPIIYEKFKMIEPGKRSEYIEKLLSNNYEKKLQEKEVNIRDLKAEIITYQKHYNFLVKLIEDGKIRSVNLSNKEMVEMEEIEYW